MVIASFRARRELNAQRVASRFELSTRHQRGRRQPAHVVQLVRRAGEVVGDAERGHLCVARTGEHDLQIREAQHRHTGIQVRDLAARLELELRRLVERDSHLQLVVCVDVHDMEHHEVVGVRHLARARIAFAAPTCRNGGGPDRRVLARGAAARGRRRGEGAEIRRACHVRGGGRSKIHRAAGVRTARGPIDAEVTGGRVDRIDSNLADLGDGRKSRRPRGRRQSQCEQYG